MTNDEGPKWYCVMNIKTGDFLNWAEKKKKLFSKNFKYETSNSPFPTLRPFEHIEKHFRKWIDNTPNPEDYVIVCMRMSDIVK